MLSAGVWHQRGAVFIKGAPIEFQTRSADDCCVGYMRSAGAQTSHFSYLA